jgi:hypothetical protein
MAVVVELAPEVEASLREQAAREGKSLPVYLAEWIEQRISTNSGVQRHKRSLLELEGAGAEMWREELAGKDAQEYVNQMRDKDWEHRLG